MNKKEIKEQLREICTAANSLAGALCSLQVRLSADIMLDDAVEDVENQDTEGFMQLLGIMGDGLNKTIRQETAKINPVIKAIQQEKETTHHCGQDAGKPIDGMKHLLGYQVIGIGHGKCEGCPADHYSTPCVKVELIDGTYLCLAPQPNSIVTE